MSDQPRTQEAEEALDAEVRSVEANAALQALRTQLKEATKQRDDLRRHSGNFERVAYDLQRRHTKDQERIYELERVLANLGIQLTAGGSGDPAGGEVE